MRWGQKTPLISWRKGGIKNIGIASDNILHDPFELLRFSNYLALAYVQQYERDSIHLIPSAWETLEMATIGSARALGLGDEVGSLEVGKKADVIVADLKKPHLTPNLDIVSNLVHYANGNDVETTIIDGKVVMEGRIIKTVDEAEVLSNGEKASREVWQDFNNSYRQFPEVAEKFKYFT
jgi:cytosine/adenosine deaminase-related metal-dependent hydrolase